MRSLGGIEEVSVGAGPAGTPDWPFYGPSVGAALILSRSIGPGQRGATVSPARLFDFTKRLRLTPGRAYCVAGKVNSVNTLYLVIESARLDTRHERLSTAPVPADGAGGSPVL